nr:hypothetical protein GCM10010200_065830 [Actinomadura rugatobispora]
MGLRGAGVVGAGALGPQAQRTAVPCGVRDEHDAVPPDVQVRRPVLKLPAGCDRRGRSGRAARAGKGREVRLWGISETVL